MTFSVSREIIDILENTRAIGTTFGLFGSLFNVVLTGCRELPPCNSCLDVIPTELSEWRNPPKRKQTSYGRGFLRALRLVEMTLLGLTTAHIIVGACIASPLTVLFYHTVFIQENNIFYPLATNGRPYNLIIYKNGRENSVSN